MGVMETKIIQVKNDPNTINATNEAWGRWGWSVLSVQVTHSQNTKQYQDWAQYGSNEVTVETTTINYATITYQRDKGMPGYDRITELEQEYDQVESRVRAQFQARRDELQKEKEKLPRVYYAGCGTIVGLLIFALISISFVCYDIIIYVKYNQLPSDWIATFVLIVVSLYLLFRLIKSKSPDNKALCAKREQMLNSIETELAEIDTQWSNMIEEEKTRLVEEAAQILRSA